ncbi:hypothetical protein B5807_01003 [Epicoccum nigrum]|uniref:Borealin N-terminal domain-containing protein n=1 Tax=Epicoccum nigrum TaxID=105696 RepID=A0A1Y2MFQ8_EPING|nr:hypothetical protein B5807_01003 [Epicoccum nigrum]
MVAPITEEAKAAMLANFDLEVNARKEKLRSMCEAQCASLRSRLERRVNRVPATKRQMPLIELLAPPPPPQPKPAPAPVKAAPAKKAPTKKAAAAAAAAAASIAPVPAHAPPAKARSVPTLSRAATVKAPKPPAKPVAKHAASKSVPTASTRGKKRSSEEAASDDKENLSIDLAVPKKRSRAATATIKQPAAAAKASAPAARSTRAASRQGKSAPADILSPKNSNTRTKPATRSVRQK